jgi:hypothetical protein
MWLCKRKNIINKKRKKWTSVKSIKTMGTLMPVWKKEIRRKDRSCSLTFISKFKREALLRSIVKLWLATINIHLIPYTYTSWFDCMTQLSLDPLFDFTIYVCKYVFS